MPPPLTQPATEVNRTVDRAADLGLLPTAAEYVIKPKPGADSAGLRFVRSPGLSLQLTSELPVEPEDLNPYLSPDRVAEPVREAFVTRMRASLRDLLA